jgi:hypothetical protein
MSRRYDSPAIDPAWREARDKARRLTRGHLGRGAFGYYVGCSRKRRKASQRVDRADWFEAILCDTLWTFTVQSYEVTK